jgi:hypothetical protein
MAGVHDFSFEQARRQELALQGQSFNYNTTNSEGILKYF